MDAIIGGSAVVLLPLLLFGAIGFPADKSPSLMMRLSGESGQRAPRSYSLCSLVSMVNCAVSRRRLKIVSGLRVSGWEAINRDCENTNQRSRKSDKLFP